MSRTVAAYLLAAARSTSGAEPMWLFEIPTGLVAPTVLRYTTNDDPVVWNGVVWSPLPAEPPSMQFDGPGTGRGRTLTIGDGDGVIGGYVEAGAVLEGQTVVMHLTDITATGGVGADALLSEEYIVESVARGEGYVTLSLAGELGSFDRKVPGVLMTRALFPGLAPGPLL